MTQVEAPQTEVSTDGLRSLNALLGVSFGTART